MATVIAMVVLLVCCGYFYFCGSFILMGWWWTDFDELQWLWANRLQVVVGLILGFGYGGLVEAS